MKNNSGVFLFLCLLFGVKARHEQHQQHQQQRWMDCRGRRAGEVMGLEDGRLSLAKVSAMLTSSIHMELAGSEDAFRRLLDHEWDKLSARPPGTRGSFLVCSAPGRANAKRLRELAGADSLVETLHRRKGEILCSFASLDAATAALVAADGSGDGAEGGGGRGTFSVEPLPHFAKLAPVVAAEPSPAALLLSSEAAAAWAEGQGERDDAGAKTGDEVYVEDDDKGGKAKSGGHLRAGAGAGGDKKPTENGRLSAEQRARVLAGAAADRPTTRRLIRDGESGVVDAIEITLVNHHERRSKSETEDLARGWLSLARDQSALAESLRAEHFWGRPRGLSRDEEEEEEERTDGGIDEEGGRRGKGRRRRAPEEADVPTSAAEEQPERTTGERAQELAAYAKRKQLGWAGVLDAVDRGRGQSAGSGGDRAGAGTASAGSCRFDRATFTVSPSGKKVLLHRPHEMAAAAAAAGSGVWGDEGKVSGDDNGCLSALLAYISLQPEVRYVTARKKSVTMNLDAAWVSQSGVDGYTPLWDENLQGQNEIIGVADTGLDMNHCQFREDDGDNVESSDWDDPVTDLTKRKVVQYIKFVDDFDQAGGHGTHVAGTLAGAQSGEEAGDDEGDGMAFQGKLAVFDFGDSDNPDNVLSTPEEVDEMILQPAYDAGARVHSNSWGTVSIEYTSLNKEMDEFVYTHQDLLVVLAAGNCGDIENVDPTDKCVVLDPDEGTVISPAQGKNVVAVGASESAGVSGKDPETVFYKSSKGPTIDGRIKPDVVAPGDPNWSAYADPTATGETCGFGTQEGTSMAAPVVAGNGAMARQYFREGWYNGAKNVTQGFEPSAALLKAVLINSATAMSFAGVNPTTSALDVTLVDAPDMHQGFGRVTMVNALNINATVGLFFEDWVDIREGELLEYDVSLYEDADLDKDLRVTLVWTDPPASVGSTSALVHDLDLVVIAQSTGTEYYPNGLDGADSVNNVEKVVITDTTEGETYTIRVSCDELSDADLQSFAVIANGEFIKTNDLPTTPDPSDWLDLVDQAAANIFTWKFGAVLALGVLACCAMAFACRRVNRSRAHQSKINQYRREITNNRGGPRGGGTPGRKMRPTAPRPQPFDGPVRVPSSYPGELKVPGGPGTFQESWRRPEGSGSIGGRSTRSMRSEQSARGALLTGAGAVVPGQSSEGSHETCPECGLRLPDAVQLVKHVETRHGGRAARKREAAGAPEVGHTPGTTTAGPGVVESMAVEPNGRNGAPAVTVAPSKDAPPPGTGTTYEDAHAATTADVGAKPSPLSRPPSISPESAASLGRHGGRPRKQDDGGGGSGEESRGSASPAARDSVTDPRSLPVRVATGAGGGGSDSGSRSPGESSKRSAGLGKPLTGSFGGEKGRGQGHERGREAAPWLEHPGRGLVKDGSTRSLTRTSSLDRMSALSSRAITRSTRRRAAEEEGAAGDVVGGIAGGDDDDGAAHEAAARARMISRRRILPSASTEDTVPSAHRLTAEKLRALGSGLPENFKLPPSVFSPVKTSAKEPAYSPVARERAGELDKERPVSLTRKFLRQFSGDGSPVAREQAGELDKERPVSLTRKILRQLSGDG